MNNNEQLLNLIRTNKLFERDYSNKVESLIDELGAQLQIENEKRKESK